MTEFRLMCGIIGALCCGAFGIISGWTSGTKLGPKILKAKQIWDELTSDLGEDD